MDKNCCLMAKIIVGVCSLALRIGPVSKNAWKITRGFELLRVGERRRGSGDCT
jgi:hypothetical protein